MPCFPEDPVMEVSFLVLILQPTSVVKGQFNRLDLLTARSMAQDPDLSCYSSADGRGNILGWNMRHLMVRTIQSVLSRESEINLTRIIKKKPNLFRLNV